MKMTAAGLLGFVLFITVGMLPRIAAQDDPLPSWKPSASKTAIMEFVERVTDKKHRDYVRPSERIAVFDNDGTLWSEQPFYFQLAFAIDRIKQLAADHPNWKTEQPFKAAIEGDLKTLIAGGEHAMLKLVMASHAGNTTEEFAAIVKKWIDTARHPKTKRLYREMVYQPMLEVLEYLREHDFKTWIVSGGGIEFMRPWANDVYGIPPEQVIGSTIKTKFEMRENGPVIVRLPEIDFVDDKEGKPVAIDKYIGRRPIAAFGNSDGDLQMLQWTTAGKGARLAVIVHHTDADREWSYDRESSIGRLDVALDQAKSKGWSVVDMKNDWALIFPFQKKKPERDQAAKHHYFSKDEHSHEVTWGYDGNIGPAFWGKLDASFRLADQGKSQSPININSEQATKAALPRLIFDYRREKITAYNNGHTIQHDDLPGSFLYVGEQRYGLEQFHVHTPSEHTIDGKRYPLEIHFVHKTKGGQVAVVAVLAEVGDQPDDPKLPPYQMRTQRENDKVRYTGRKNPSDYLPSSREYYAYLGSFTTPPCTEGIKWFVMKEPIKVDRQVIAEIRAELKSNNRPVQKMNDRRLLKSK